MSSVPSCSNTLVFYTYKEGDLLDNLKDSSRTVVASGNHTPSIGRHIHVEDGLGKTLKFPLALARPRIPQADSSIQTAGEETEVVQE